MYASCMFQPTYEKFLRKADAMLSDENLRIFSAQCNGILGLIAVRQWDSTGEICGIAVAGHLRGHGIGSLLIRTAMNRMELTAVTAETDDDAVGFYRKVGFTVTAFEKDFGDSVCRRYRCEFHR